MINYQSAVIQKKSTMNQETLNPTSLVLHNASTHMANQYDSKCEKNVDNNVVQSTLFDTQELLADFQLIPIPEKSKCLMYYNEQINKLEKAV